MCIHVNRAGVCVAGIKWAVSLELKVSEVAYWVKDSH